MLCLNLEKPVCGRPRTSNADPAKGFTCDIDHLVFLSAGTGTEDGASCFVHFTNIKRGMYDVGDNQYGNARAKNLLFVLQQLLKLASNTADHFFLVWLFVQVMSIARD